MASTAFHRAIVIAPLGSIQLHTRIATNCSASIGRGSGGVHGYRSRKGRRRRPANNNQEDSVISTNDAYKNVSLKRTSRKLKRRPSKQENNINIEEASPVEEVAPVAVTILTDPQLFETPSDKVAEEGSKSDEQEQIKEDQTASEAQNVQGEVTKVVEQVSQVVAQIGHKVVDDVLPETLVVQAEQVAQAAEVLVEQVTTLPVVEKVVKVTEQVTEQVASLIRMDDSDWSEDDEFEAYTTSDLPEFRGIRGIENFTVLQENYGVVSVIYDFYIYMLKRPVTQFALAMFAAPVGISLIFTMLYLPQVQGLAFGEDARNLWSSSSMSGRGLESVNWETVFQVFMFSISLSTGLEPELAPLTPYTLVVANVNALVAQLLFVFLSGAVFARLSQPSQPIRCSSVALISPVMRKNPDSSQSSYRVFMARYALAGPQPCELVDVKVDLTYKYNTITRSGTYFRATQSLKLVRSEVAYLNYGMLVRHIIDETSPLHKRTPEMLKKEDGIFTLSVVGLERSSMQSVFHAQHYSIDDGHVIWDAEFEDMILISKRNRRIVDHSRLSAWRPA